MLAILLLTLAVAPAGADDTDAFVRRHDNGFEPLVLFHFEPHPALAPYVDTLRSAFELVVDELTEVRVGVVRDDGVVMGRDALFAALDTASPLDPAPWRGADVWAAAQGQLTDESCARIGIVAFTAGAEVHDADGLTGILAEARADEPAIVGWFVTAVPHDTFDALAVAAGTSRAHAVLGDPAALAAVLRSILRDARAMATTFTAREPPRASFVRTLHDGDLYLAQFRPDPDGRRRWPGNVKRVEMPVDEGAEAGVTDGGFGQRLAQRTTPRRLFTDPGLVVGGEQNALVALALTTSERDGWILGDILHSRPLPIRYDEGIRVLVGSNDGFLHAFDADTGDEAWAFMPRAVAANLDAPDHAYGVDGTPVAYRDGARVIVYFGLRRGGRAYYALDVTEPDAPTLLWRVTSADAGFERLGYTFSTPQVGTVAVDVEGAMTVIPVVVFAGGYDPAKDLHDVQVADDTLGATIHVVHALTGTSLWRAGHDDLVDSIASDVTALDTSGDGHLDRVYVGDTGGRVWRADLVGGPEHWTVELLASIGRHAGEHDRRFFHAPDVVPARDTLGVYDAVIIGSGNRADPMATATHDSVFLFKDRRAAGAPLGPSELADARAGDGWGLLGNGWRLPLTGDGEKSLATPATVAGTVYFTTWTPPASAPGTCAPPAGETRIYAVALDDAAAQIDFETENDENAERERSRRLHEHGVPAEIVFAPPADLLLPDLTRVTTALRARILTDWSRATLDGP